MGAIEDIYADLDADITLEEFRSAVADKVEQMGGLADEETAAMLIAHELDDNEVNTIADISLGPDEVTFLAKVTTIGDLRTFERDDSDEPGHVINVDAADETGSIRLVFWDDLARAVVEEDLEPGTTLRIRGRPREGYNGIEVSVYQAEPDPDVDLDVVVDDIARIENLSLGQSSVTLHAQVLGISEVRTFERDEGEEGRVANLTVGDETGRIRVTLWDDRTEFVEAVSTGDSIEVIDGYVRERDDDLELHVGNRGAIHTIDESIEYVPRTIDIADLEMDQVADIAGIVRSVDPVRTFDRDDGSQGKVRNVRIEDQTGDVRVALWGAQAEIEIGPGDRVLSADVRIKEGWQDDIEASAGWQSTISVLERASGVPISPASSDGTAGLDSFTEQTSSETGTAATESSDPVEFTGTVVQTGDPVILDDGTETMIVHTDQGLTLGQEVTARGTMQEDRLIAEDVF